MVLVDGHFVGGTLEAAHGLTIWVQLGGEEMVLRGWVLATDETAQPDSRRPLVATSARTT